MRCFGARPFGLGGLIEQQDDGAVAFEERETLALDDAEVARVAQVIACQVLP